VTLTDLIPSLRTSIPARLDHALWPQSATLRHGDVALGRIPLADLVDTYGTPTYVVDEEDVRTRCRAYRHAFSGGEVAYASKAFLSRAVAEWVNQEALSLDVSSIGELAVACCVNFPADRILLHGNAKTPEFLRSAIDYGVGRIVIDCMSEIPRIAALAETRQRVLIRVTPNVDADTHVALATGIADQQFGLPIESAHDAIRRVLGQPGLELVGLHCHLGSQITQIEPYEIAARRLLDLIADVRREHGVTLHELNLGGGHGIPYVTGDQELDVTALAKRLRAVVKDECRTRSIVEPRITVEPGRSIVGRSAVALYRVIAIKHGIRTFVAVDGGMSDNPRPALYGAQYTMRLVGRVSHAAPALMTIVGQHCEAGDILARDIPLPDDLRPGDVLAMPCAGAYQAAMASNYNLAQRPAVVAVHGGMSRVLLRRETAADLLARDMSPR